MSQDPAAALPKPAGSARFARQRERILEAATTLINLRGVKGMTFQELGRMVGLTNTGITYYFRFKEDLAAAVFAQTLDRFEAAVADAASAPDPQARVARFYELHFQALAGVVRGQAHLLAVLSDIRALEAELRAPLEAHYRRIFRMVLGFFAPPADAGAAALAAARTQIVLEVAFWLPAWIGQYALGDFDRVRARLLDILGRGLAPAGEAWRPCQVAPDGAGDLAGDAGRAGFLRAATRLTNAYGYRGASVERIAAELGVTKGSFYHHLDAKDDLVFECFRQSYRRIARAMLRARETGGTQWEQLTAAICRLLAIQFTGDWPLLRTTALHALPLNLRDDVVERSNRTALRFAGSISDGIGEGSVRGVDALVASQVIMAMLNGACDMRAWAEPLGIARAVDTYGVTLAVGLFGECG